MTDMKNHDGEFAGHPMSGEEFVEVIDRQSTSDLCQVVVDILIEDPDPCISDMEHGDFVAIICEHVEEMINSKHAKKTTYHSWLKDVAPTYNLKSALKCR
jgi:hypothetical protein